jgi:hypothetical protein
MNWPKALQLPNRPNDQAEPLWTGKEIVALVASFDKLASSMLPEQIARTLAADFKRPLASVRRKLAEAGKLP